MRPLEAGLLFGEELYREVIVGRLMQARESVWIATANLKEMYVEPASEPAVQVPATGRAAGRTAARGPGGRATAARVAAVSGIDRKRPFRSIMEVFTELARRRVELRILHAELPSRPFRAAFDKVKRLWSGGLQLKICPRVHLKTVIVDGAWIYLGSANMTGAGLGARSAGKRNFEVGFVTEDFEVIDRVTALYQSIWRGHECKTCRLRDLCPDPIDTHRP